MKTAFPKPPAPAVVVNKITHQLGKKLTTTLPKVIKRLPDPPFVLQKKVAEKLLENLLAEQIEMGEFDFLQEKWLKISVNDAGVSFFLTFHDGKLQLSRQITQADVSFSGNSKEFILLASRSEDPDTLFFQRRLVIEGDTELALYIKNSIDGIDFDNWPAWLKLTIDKIAIFVSDIDNDASFNTKPVSTNSSPSHHAQW